MELVATTWVDCRCSKICNLFSKMIFLNRLRKDGKILQLLNQDDEYTDAQLPISQLSYILKIFHSKKTEGSTVSDFVNRKENALEYNSKFQSHFNRWPLKTMLLRPPI